MRRLLVLAGLVLVLAVPAAAHVMPNSLAYVVSSEGQLSLETRIPLSELSAAMDQTIAPADVETRRSELEAYLRDHITVRGSDGSVWPINMERLAPGRIDDHDVLEVRLVSAWPGDTPQQAVIGYDAVNRQIASHYVLVYLGQPDDPEAAPLVRLQSPETAFTVGEDPSSPPPEPEVSPNYGAFTVPAIALALILAIGLAAFALVRRRRVKP